MNLLSTKSCLGIGAGLAVGLFITSLSYDKKLAPDHRSPLHDDSKAAEPFHAGFEQWWREELDGKLRDKMGEAFLGHMDASTCEAIVRGEEVLLPDGQVIHKSQLDKYEPKPAWQRYDGVHGFHGEESAKNFAKNYWFRDVEGRVFQRSKTGAEYHLDLIPTM